MSATQCKIWCDDDKHEQYEYFSDFNDWLDNSLLFYSTLNKSSHRVV